MESNLNKVNTNLNSLALSFKKLVTRFDVLKLRNRYNFFCYFNIYGYNVFDLINIDVSVRNIGVEVGETESFILANKNGRFAIPKRYVFKNSLSVKFMLNENVFDLYNILYNLYLNRKMINDIYIFCLDMNLYLLDIFNYSNLYILNLGDFSLEYDSVDNVTIDVNFSYDFVHRIAEDEKIRVLKNILDTFL